MKIRKQIAKLAVLLTTALLLASCGASVEAPYPAPQWALDVATPKMVDVATVESTAKVDVYYDNTQSMYGFIKEGGNVVRVATALRDVTNQYSNGTIYTLQSDGAGSLAWAPLEEDLRNALADWEGFYTVGKGSLNGIGPLQRLYYGDAAIDPKAINVVVTDLAEQNVDSGDLAARINELVLSQEGYSAVLIGIKGEFNGKKYVEDLNEINEMPGEQVQGRVPLYILITGPDASLDIYLENLLKCFDNYSLTESQSDDMADGDYVVARYFAGNGARVLSKDDILTVQPAKEQDGMRRDDWQTAAINENLMLREIDAAHLDTLIDTDGYLNIFTYEYDNQVNDANPKRILLNYFLPVERTDGVDRPIELHVYETDDQAPTTQLEPLYATKERVRYAELVEEEDYEEYGSAGGLLDEKPEFSDVYELRNDDNELTGLYGWRDIRQISRDKDVQVKYEMVSAGQPVYDMLMELDGRDLDDIYPGTPLDLPADKDLLHISIEYSIEPEEREGSTSLLYIPVYAMAEQVENIPSWIETWDSATSSDYVYHTFGLENFFRTLFGLNVTGDPEFDRALREVKIADLLTCVTNLPTA